MSDAKLWIDEVGCTAMITRPNVSYTMPLWVFEDMREIIVAEAEKKVEVTHRDFDIQQELLDRYRAENAKLRKLAAEMYPYAKAFLQEGLILGYIDSKSYDWFLQLRELGVEVE